MRRSIAAVALAVIFAGVSAAQAPAPPTEIAYVVASTINVREGPGTYYAVVATLSRAERVSVLERAEEWARIEAGAASGWVASRYLDDSAPPAPQTILTDARIRNLIIAQSLSFYSGSCPCPYNVDRGGRSCGGRSAYSRPGGASPLCYSSDVSDAAVRAYREQEGN